MVRLRRSENVYQELTSVGSFSKACGGSWVPLQINAEPSPKFWNLLWIPYLGVTEDDLVWFPQGQRLVAGSYLSLIVEWGEGWEVTSRFPRFNFSVSFMFATDHKCKFVTHFCHQSPQSIFHLGAFAVAVVIYSCSNGKEKLAVCLFQRKEAQFQVHPRFPFHPTRGGSLKVIFSASFGLGFALSRTREIQTFAASALYSLIMGEKEQGTY